MLLTALVLLLASEAPAPGTAENPYTCWRLETMRLAVTAADQVIVRAEIVFEDTLAPEGEDAVIGRIVIDDPAAFPVEAMDWVFPLWDTVKELPDCNFSIKMRWWNELGAASDWSAKIYVKKRWSTPPSLPVIRFEVQTLTVSTQP